MRPTIMNVPLAPLRPLISTRTWNLLTRNGFEKVADVQFALTHGLQPGDIRGLSAAALLEIRIAIDSLPPAPGPPVPPVAENPLPSTPPAAGNQFPGGFSERELQLILALAETSTDRLPPQYSVNETEAALARLREIARPMPYTADVEPDGRITLKDATGTSLPRSKSRGEDSWDVPAPPPLPAPEPVDDEGFEGYVIEPRPGWGQF